MKNTAAERLEKLIRVNTSRREIPVQLQVRYSITRENGCDNYQILAINDGD
jgi:hypothetical protein